MSTTVSIATWDILTEEIIAVRMDVMAVTVIFLVSVEETSIVQTARELSEV